MAKLPVKLQNIFAGALPPSGNIAEPGSTVAGSTVYSNDPAALQSLAAWGNGVAAQVFNASGGLNAPILEEMNGILYVLTYQLAYLKQAGIAEWDPTVVYYTGSWAMIAGIPYVSKTDNNVNHNPTSDATNWKTFASTILSSLTPLMKAWVVFDGTTGAIDSSYNVSSVNRTSAGKYVVNFTAAMADAKYGFSGSCGTRPGLGALNGDDNIVNGGVPGATPIRTTTQCSIYAFDRPSFATEDAGIISVQFFGNP